MAEGARQFQIATSMAEGARQFQIATSMAKGARQFTIHGSYTQWICQTHMIVYLAIY